MFNCVRWLVYCLTVTHLAGPVAVNAQMSCGPRMSPRMLMSIPCDMTTTNYCALPGAGYPWRSVRRYIYENQGLMKRMYGAERHSEVLRNDIDDYRDKYDSISFYNNRAYFSDHPYIRPRSAFRNHDQLPENNFERAFTSSTEDTNRVPVSSSESPSTSSSTIAISKTTTAAVRSENKVPVEAAEMDFATPTENVSLSSSTWKTEKTTWTTDANASYDKETTTTVEELESTPMFYANVDLTTMSDEPIVKVSAKPGVVTPSTTTSTAGAPVTEGFKTEPIPKKGVNACPVKDEVIAPYWANNTRGEVLALLNVYPFEQYVHWEKCAFENSQMFCRDGCRCEQQYRLHRLLAFDPKNECKGIFADWFRFPSCCVCICYDLPDTNVFYRVNRRKSRL